jgi:hypothetical protein
MKKLMIIIMFILFSISMSGCVSTTEEPTTEESINTSFVPVDSATIETDQVTFSVQINTILIDDSNTVVTVVVEITTKVVINQTLETSSYGDEGLIRIRIVSIDNEDILMYSEFYDIQFTDDEYDVDLNIGEELTRTIQFARMPFHGGAGGELPSPTGVYKVQVSLFSPEIIWIDTELFITVK